MNEKVADHRLSLNQITTENWNLKEAAAGCAEQGIEWIGIWRHKVHEIGLKEAKQTIKNYNLKVSSLCRGGMFPAATDLIRQERIDDNKRAIEEAAELGAEVLVLVCGPSPDKDLQTSRRWVQEGIEAIVPFAEDQGVKLGIEPLHPMYAADRSVIVTLGEANEMQRAIASKQVGVIVDVFHVWWDPLLYKHIEDARGSILGFHVSDWKVPIHDLFKARSFMGEGIIDIPRIRKAVDHQGYDGPIEVEIMNQSIWDLPGEETLQKMKASYRSHV